MSWWWQSSWTAPPDTPSPAPSPRRSPPRPPPLPLIHFLNSPPQVPLCSHLLVSQSCTGKNGSFDFVSLFVMFAPLLPFLVVFDELPPALLLVSLKSWTFNFEMTLLFLSFHKFMSWHNHLSLAPVLFFSLLFCKSSIATVVVIVTRKPRECLRIQNKKERCHLFVFIPYYHELILGAWHFKMKTKWH